MDTVNLKRKKYERCRNMFGPLGGDIIKRLELFFAHPSQECWDDVYSIIIGADGWTTFWQAVLAVDPNFPRIAEMEEDYSNRWERVPDFFYGKKSVGVC